MAVINGLCCGICQDKVSGRTDEDRCQAKKRLEEIPGKMKMKHLTDISCSFLLVDAEICPHKFILDGNIIIRSLCF